jgi:hypothetical protein
MIFELYLHVLKTVEGYHSHSIPLAGCHLLKIVFSDLVDKVLPISP